MFDSTEYEIRQKTGLTSKYNIYEDGEQILSAKKKIKLKEDFRFMDMDDEEKYRITTDSIVDFDAAYTIVESETGDVLGAVKRKGLKSLLKQEWEIQDSEGNVIASLEEDNWKMAFARRNLTTLIPFNYNAVSEQTGDVLGQIEGQLSLRDKYSVTMNENSELKPELLVLAGVVVDAIEGN